MGSRLRNMLAYMLVFAILLSYSQSQLIHIGAHEHHHEHTSAEAVDPCHTAVYHSELNIDCGHGTHYSDHVVHCQLCDFVITYFTEIKCASNLEAIFLPYTQNIHLHEFEFNQIPNYSRARAPPLVS